MSDSLNTLIDMLKILVRKKFTGSIEVHFSEGGVSKVIKHENMK